MNAVLLSTCNSCRKVKGPHSRKNAFANKKRRGTMLCTESSSAPFRHVLVKWIYCNSLYRVIAHQTKKAGGDIPPS